MYVNTAVLSSYEAEKYFLSDKDRQCIVTTAAKTNDSDIVSWWLRDAWVSKEGAITQTFIDTNRGVRPAMWIDISE